MRALYLGLAMAGMLAACGGGDEAETEAPGLETATDTPSVVPGLWRMTSDAPGVPALAMCVGEDSEALDRAMGVNREQCSEYRMTRTASGWTVHAVCQAEGGLTMTLDQEVSGDPSSRLAFKSRIAASGGGAPAGFEQTISMEMTREGDCPEGMGPGAVDTGSMIIDGSQMKAPASSK